MTNQIPGNVLKELSEFIYDNQELHDWAGREYETKEIASSIAQFLVENHLKIVSQ